ncbi:MAG: cytochrome P450, partial [Mycobacteriaceae bacterium]
MSKATVEISKNDLSEVYAIPLEDIDVSNPELFRSNTMHEYFKRLRLEDPVHYCKNGMFGPYWSVTKFADIMQVDTNPQIFSSEGNITIMDANAAASLPMFIAMDPPKHDDQRKIISPIVAPENLAKLESLIRERTCNVLDGLPINETFNWVERVSINLTTQMLATLFDFPWEDRAKLTHWSDVATTLPGAGLIDSEEERLEQLTECAQYMTKLWNERVNAAPGNDLISMMAHSDATRDMTPEEFLGNLILLIVGGNDTTRNSMTGG